MVHKCTSSFVKLLPCPGSGMALGSDDEGSLGPGLTKPSTPLSKEIDCIDLDSDWDSLQGHVALSETFLIKWINRSTFPYPVDTVTPIPYITQTDGDAQWSRTWGVGYFGVNFFFAFFLLVWTPFIYMGWEKMFRVHKITDYVVKIGCFRGLWGHFTL